MELLIPGLILVALMVYASTKIKKRAAAAFDPERIETDSYLLEKPDGFLHVIDDPDHELRSYSKEFGEEENSGHRRAIIELDLVSAGDLDTAMHDIDECAENSEIISRSDKECVIETDEAANETRLKGFYKIVANGKAVYKLRFAVIAEHVDEYSARIKETLDSFNLK